MIVPTDVHFPEVTNSQVNVAMLADKMNETLAFLREKYPEGGERVDLMDFLAGSDERLATGNVFRELKPGVRAVDTPRGPRYFLKSRMIKAVDAFV